MSLGSEQWVELALGVALLITVSWVLVADVLEYYGKEKK